MKELVCTLTSKGQVTLPKDLRKTLALNTGDKIKFEIKSLKGAFITKQAKSGSASGILKHLAPKSAIRVEEMNAVIAEHVGEKFLKNA